MAGINELILYARRVGASDIHISEGLDTVIRINGQLFRAPENMPSCDPRSLILEMLTMYGLSLPTDGSDLDFALTSSDKSRQRVNVFHQSRKLASTIRLLNSKIPDFNSLGLPAILRNLSERPRGLVLITGPTGSGKSTTLAAMIEHINCTRPEHIITIEDPIEYVYEPKLSLIHQREVGQDTCSFASSLRSSLREDPDIILVGEMRDFETISAALTAAETGHLVMSTLHTTGAAQTIDRIIDACPAGSQNQIRTQLAGVLNGVVTQCLIRTPDGRGRVPATEVLVGTDAALNLIRENKCHQLATIMQSSFAEGMHTLNNDLTRLSSSGRITREDAFRYSNDKKDLSEFL